MNTYKGIRMNTDTIILLIGLIGFGVIFLIAHLKKEKEDPKDQVEDNKLDRIMKIEEALEELKKEIKILSLPQGKILTGEDAKKSDKCPLGCEMILNNKIMGLEAKIKNDLDQLRQDMQQLDDVYQYTEEDIKNIVRRLFSDNLEEDRTTRR